MYVWILRGFGRWVAGRDRSEELSVGLGWVGIVHDAMGCSYCTVCVYMQKM